MTVRSISNIKKAHPIRYATAILMLILLSCSRVVSQGVYQGARFAFSCLVPTLFPFFIIGDMIFHYGLPFDTWLKKSGLWVIVIGVICGFPHGTRIATRLYSEGKINFAEYERLLVLSNAPSVAFVIAGVGSGMLGSTALGIILYISLLLSIFTLSLLVRSEKSAHQGAQFVLDKQFSLTDSIRNAGASCITVSSFVIFFYGLHSLTSHLINNARISALLAIFLEIGTGAGMLAKDQSLSHASKIPLLGFCIGFSSISVFMQCSAFTDKFISRKKLFAFKFIQGVLVAIYAFLLTYVYKKWLL